MIDYILHFDTHLSQLITDCGPWIYLLLGAVLFGETGLLVLPFLPGDTLLFACGVAAAQINKDTGDPSLNLALLLTILPASAILGDSTNYAIGHALRRYRQHGGRVPIVKPELIDKSIAFFERYGSWAVVLGRWIPLVRTVVPFTAGLSAISYKRFLAYSALGNVLWVTAFVMLGYGLGEVAWVKDNVGLIFLLLIACVIASILGRIITPLITSKARAKLHNEPTPVNPRSRNDAASPRRAARTD